MRENREKHKLKWMLSWLIYFDFFIAFRILNECTVHVCNMCVCVECSQLGDNCEGSGCAAALYV